MKKEIKDENVIPMDSIFEWNYRDAPHGLITGITKGGKTYELFYLIRQLLARGVDIYIVDPKLADLSTLDKYIGTKCVFEKEDIVNLVEKYAKDMKARYREIRKRPDFKAGKDYYDYGYQPKFLIFDECMSFFGGSTEKNDKKTVKDYLLDVIAEGRQAGYFVILTSQRADTKFIDGAIRDQLGLRMSLGSLSADGYKMTFGSSDYKLRDTKKGAGFIYIDGLGMKKGKEYISPMIPKSYDFFEDFENLIQLEEDDSKVKAENKKVIQANFNQKNNDEEVTFEQLQKQKLEENENKKADEK
jgi:DNA segregation ATPase FtsK/SpoIIIE-like protein